MKQNGQQEIIDKFDIESGRRFNIKRLVRMLIADNLNENQRKVLNNQIIDMYCRDMNIDINYNITSQYQTRESQDTIAMWLTKNKCFVPKNWMHDQNIRNNDQKTLYDLMKENLLPIPQQYQNISNMSIFDQAYFGITPDIEDHKPEEQNNQGFTVAMLLACNEINIPGQWRHDPNIQNIYKQTVATIQAMNNDIPDKQWIHNKYLRCMYQITMRDRNDNIQNKTYYYTIQNILQQKNINVPEEWSYNVLNDNEDNQAMIGAKAGLIPDLDNNDPYYQNKDGDTVAMILVKKGIIPPQQWMHDINLENRFHNSLRYQFENSRLPMPQQPQANNQISIFDQACQKQIPNINGHQSNEQNQDGFTVGMILVINNIIPPRQWMHNYNIQNRYGQTLKDLMIEKYMPIPQHWQNDSDMTIYDKACFSEIPVIEGHQSDEQNEDGFTIAMILAYNNIEIPNQWYHDSQIQNRYYFTVAMYQAMKGNIPDEQWIHNRYLRCKCKHNNYFCYYTVQNILQLQNIKVPEQWQYVQLNNDEDSQAMIDAKEERIPKRNNDDPNYQNKNGLTAAMLIALFCKVIPPREWQHDPELQDREGVTVAMKLAYKGIIPPQQWQHNPNIKNMYNYSVAMYIAQYCKQTPSEHWNHNITDQNIDSNTLGIILAENGIIPPRRWMHDNKIENNFGQTIGSLLQDNKLPVPKHWDSNMTIFDQACFRIVPNKQQYNNKEQDEDGFTIAMILTINNINIPKEWEHDSNLQNNYSQTVATIMAQKRIQIPEQWQHNPEIKDDQSQTVAIIYAKQGRIPPEVWHHDPLIHDNDNNTVAILLAKKGIIPPKQWMHDISLENSSHQSIKSLLQQRQLPLPHHWNNDDMDQFDQACYGEIPNIEQYKLEEQDDDGWTVAMILVRLNKEIPQQWKHNKFIRNKYGQTVQNIYQRNKQQIPGYWQYACEDSNENTKAMIQAAQGIVPDKQYYHDPLQTNIYNQTVAILLSQQGIIPPREWMHDLNIKSNVEKTIKSNLIKYQLPIPHHWKDNDMNQFDQACFGIIPEIQNYNPNGQNDQGFTVAMILAINNIEIPEYWYHNPNIRNKYGYTVALIQAKNNVIPQHQWYHDKFLRAQYQNMLYSVHSFLIENNILNVPKHWWYKIENQQEDSKALQMAYNGKIPNKQKEYPGDYQNVYGQTVAMLLAQRGIIIPEQWRHSTAIKDRNGNTVAMYYINCFKKLDVVKKQEIIQEYNKFISYLQMINEWHHDPLIKFDHNNTIALKLLKLKIFPPQQWLHDFNIQNDEFKSIELLLIEYNILKQEEQSILCECSHQSNIYLNHNKHKICSQCFQNSCLNQDQPLCPVCRENIYNFVQIQLYKQMKQSLQNNQQGQFQEQQSSSSSQSQNSSQYNDNQSLNSSYQNQEQRSHFADTNDN